MKVRTVRSVGRALSRAALAVAIISATLVAPVSAGAITRSEIIARSKKWVAKRVPYSQNRYYRGYRQDCSGFVSMAWGLKRSYTSRTLASRARRVAISNLKPGDVVWKPGHVSIFGGWKNKRKRTYYALEQTTWGSHAKKRVRTVPRNAKGLRRDGLKRPVRKVASAPSPTVNPTVGAVAAAALREGSSGSSVSALTVLTPAIP